LDISARQHSQISCALSNAFAKVLFEKPLSLRLHPRFAKPPLHVLALSVDGCSYCKIVPWGICGENTNSRDLVDAPPGGEQAVSASISASPRRAYRYYQLAGERLDIAHGKIFICMPRRLAPYTFIYRKRQESHPKGNISS
jgi:hypothetical protein